jgi:arylsulfatase A-like enzyme
MDPCRLALAGAAVLCACAAPALSQEPAKRPNIVMLMTDDTGWNDFGAYTGGGAVLGHPTPNIDRVAEEGVLFTNWYGQASCTAGRASFMTGRIPIRSALSVVVVPGDENGLKAETPTIAEFFQKNGYKTYFSGKWHLGDKPEYYPIEHGFDEMKHFAAYYPGVYAYSDTSPKMHPWFPTYNAEFMGMYNAAVNLGEWEGVAGQPATEVATIDYDYLAEFDVRQTDSAVAYIEAHSNDPEPFFMDVNFMKMHNPNNPAEAFRCKSRLGNYSDAILELDSNIGRVMDAIRAHAADGTIVIITADNGAWQDAWPDAGTSPFRGEKGSAFEGGWRVPGIMWWPGKIEAGSKRGEMMSHIDAWATLAKMVGLEPPPADWVGDDGKPVYFDSVDNSAYILGEAEHSARTSWVYIDGETFGGVRADVSGDPENPGLNIAWKYLHRQGHLARTGAEPRLLRLALQPDDGPVREIRHDVQRRRGEPDAHDVARPIRRRGQRLVRGACLRGHARVQPVDHQISQPRPRSRRCLERSGAESARSGRPGPLPRSRQSAPRRRQWRLRSDHRSDGRKRVSQAKATA